MAAGLIEAKSLSKRVVRNGRELAQATKKAIGTPAELADATPPGPDSDQWLGHTTMQQGDKSSGETKGWRHKRETVRER